MIRIYYIRTFYNNVVCGYIYSQYLEVIQSLKKRGYKKGLDFTTWEELH